MVNILKWVAIILSGIALLIAAFVWVYAPIRARNLAAQSEQFRAEHQSEHDAIDAQFSQHDTVVNGLKWHYVEAGNPNGTAILFMHGLPEGWYSWSEVLPLVDHNYRLIAIDMKGYGRSDQQDDNYNWHTVAQQTVDFMNSLGIQKYYVVSHDWGTIIGSVLVSDHPDHILGYVRMEADLLPKDNSGTIAGYIQKPQWLLFQSKFIGTFMMQDPGWFIDMIYPSRMTAPFKQVDRDYLVYAFSRPGVSDKVPNYFLKKNWDLDAAIGKICKNDFPFPVLQLQADSDPAQPKSIFADAAAQCPHVQLQWVTNASHFDNFDQPKQVADAINKFVKP